MAAYWAFPALFLIGGFAFQLLERIRPMRRFATERAVGLDILALFWAAGLTAVYSLWVVPSLHGFAQDSAVETIRSSIRSLGLPPLAIAAIAIVIVDFLNYWGHRLLHTKILWPTHAFHHSASNLYWVAGVRESPVHYFVVTFPSSVVGLLCPPETLGAWLLAMLVGPILNQHFIHSNIRAPLGLPTRVFVTPRHHFIHHAIDRTWSNSNFGFVFSFWDRFFGTYTDPAEVPNEFPLGIGYTTPTLRLLLGLSSRSTATERERQAPAVDHVPRRSSFS